MGSSIFIDPVIVMTPAQGANKTVVEEWLHNLVTWLKEALSGQNEWLHCIEATGLLEENGHFPSFATLRSLQRTYQLDINPSVIAREVNTFFRNPDWDLQARLEDLGYLVEAQDGSISIHPARIPARWPAYIQKEMQQVLITTCACKCTNHSLTSDFHMVTLKLPEQTREVTISAIVIDALPDIARDIDNKIAQTFPLLFSPEDIALPDIVHLWQQGEAGIRKAIDYQYKKNWHHTALTYRFSPSFFSTIQDAELDTNALVLMKIVRAAAAVIANKAKDVDAYDLRHLRESKTADNKQHTRLADNAKAWRLTLIKEGVGWRMHYWQIPTLDGSVIEFANLLKKHDPEEIF